MWSRKHRWEEDGLEAEFQIVEDSKQYGYDQVAIRLIVSTPKFREALRENDNWLWQSIGGNGSPKALLWARKQLNDLVALIGDQVTIRVVPSDYRRGHAYYKTLKKAGFEYTRDEFIRLPKPITTDH